MARAPSEEPTTLLRPGFDPSPLPIGTFTLRVAEGPDAGEVFALDGSLPSRALIGQSPACDVRLTDREVSRRHAAIEQVGQRLRITDLGSTNGTFVDGVAIVEAFLRGDETVRMGSTAFRVEHADTRSGVKLPAATSFGRVIGASTEMRRIYPLCERLAASSVPLVIEGETGTGKELLAEALHEQGPRASGAFVVFDCTAVAPSLMEAELFGHERGAFTGAVGARKGLLEQAHGGTLLIDEIGDLDLSLQPKLLRAIERAEVRRLGGDRALKVDVRILAATRRNLDREVQAGRFRDDLFHRLAVARVELPPLRRRRGDVTLLARHFWGALGGQTATLSGDLLLKWEDSDWPGNVRELRNAVARQLLLGDLPAGDETEPAPGIDLGELDEVLALDLPFTEARRRAIEQFERRYVERLLALHGGNVSRAAGAAGIARRYFQILRARAGR
jgi:two-component system, NtrC family, response regulator HydG